MDYLQHTIEEKKSTVTTFLIISYLASSVGFASIDHHCLVPHEEGEPENCCCIETTGRCIPGLSLGTYLPCHPMTPAHTPEEDQAFYSTDKCCENINSFHQIDDPTTPEFGPAVCAADGAVDQLLLRKLLITSRCKNRYKSHLSFQLNLPLLN